MKKRILISFALLLFIFLVGSVVAVLYIGRTTSRMDRLILLHQVEILREELIIHIQQVQSQLSRSKKWAGGDVDALIAQVQAMDKAMASCVGCHHTPELMQGLLSMRDISFDYKSAISRFVTTSTNPAHRDQLEHRAQQLGQELISMTQGMAFTANMRLQQKTRETMTTIRQVREVLVVTLLSGFLLAVIVIAILVRGLDQRLRRLLDATRRIARGDLQYRVDAVGSADAEFNELADAFNVMTNNLHRSQQRLLQATKLAAMGELATNIAYEVNSPLSGVLGYTGLLLKADDIPRERKEHIRTIEREILRARGILKNLLDFSRRKPPRLVRSDIEALVEDTIALVRGQARVARVEIRNDCPAGIPAVAIDPDEMRQVFLNLINNAFFAMQGGGILTLGCRREWDEEGREVVVVSLSDTGHGIPAEHLEKIFDPFFTTRADGGGAGLGLSISYLVVQNHGGRIDVESTVGAGSTFHVVLPAFSASQTESA
jgi:signal transduction histidine kinase